jgi:dolichol-phosphate mannosyltransferase
MNISTNQQKISVVIPVYGCSASLTQLHKRLSAIINKMDYDYEIILVNDGCPQNSWQVIVELSEIDPKVKGINLSRNFGQHYAITAGLEHADGELIVVMDCDLQDDPDELPKLLAGIDQGFDTVLAARTSRQDSWLKKLGSKTFYRLLSYLTGVEQNCDIANYGIYRKKVIQAVLACKDKIRYFPVLVRWVGFSILEVPIKHQARYEGETSYNFSKMLNLSIDIMLSFSDKPIKIIVKFGFYVSLLSFFMIIYLVMTYFMYGFAIEGWASSIVALFSIGGILMMMLGIVGLYVGKIFQQTKDRPIYFSKEKINFK